LFGKFPFLKILFADSAYQGPKFATGLAQVRPNLNVDIVKRSDRAEGFEVLPKRWIVERSIGSIAAAGWPRTGRTAIAKRLLSCASLRFASC